MSKIESLNEFALLIYSILKSDRDCIIAVSGMTGEGKSCLTTQLCKIYGKISGMGWQYEIMTWTRKELLIWIDGEVGSAIDEKGLKKGQLPIYSAINVDELFLLFYKRKWFDDDQIDAVATLNMCRDRRLLIIGNVPTFWDMDSGFQSRIRFYIFVVQRGIAWVFEQENNPFASDTWNKTKNQSYFRKLKNPYALPNFVCELRFDDWSESEKEKYYKIRNEKRVLALSEGKRENIERYKDIKEQRDKLIRYILNVNKILKQNKKIAAQLNISIVSQKEMAEMLGLSTAIIGFISEGIR